MLSQASLVTA